MEITAEIITQFRTAYPQFANTTTWPDSVVTMALCEGDVETGGKGWGGYEDDCHNFKQRGMFLYAAHWLTVNYPMGGNSTANPSPTWAANSKSVGDESISYDTGASNLNPGNAWLISTLYGQQFLRLRRRAGMGARAV